LDVADGKVIDELKLPNYWGCVCLFSPDGSLIAINHTEVAVDLSRGLASGATSSLEYLAVGRECLAISPDGGWLVSGGQKKLELWRIESLAEVQTIPLEVEPKCVAFHPVRPQVLYGDNMGGLNPVDIEALEYGPLCVTASTGGGTLTIRCPACFEEHPIKRAQLGQVIPCPGASCATQLKINPFVVQLQEPAPR
jgi:WD40 repeat protein